MLYLTTKSGRGNAVALLSVLGEKAPSGAVVNELTATLLLAPTGTSTLATEFWNLSSGIDYAGAAPYALLMILLSAPMTYLLFQQSKKAAGQ